MKTLTLWAIAAGVWLCVTISNGCSDQRSNELADSRPFGNSKVESTDGKDQDLSVVRFNDDDVDEHRYDATVKIKEGLSFEFRPQEMSSRLKFDVPLELGIKDRDVFHLTIRFLKNGTKAMRLLKSYFYANMESDHGAKTAILRKCVVIGHQLKNFDTPSLDCDFNIGSHYRLYTEQTPMVGPERDQIKNLSFKAVLLMFVKDEEYNLSQITEPGEYTELAFGYRCLLSKKKTKNPDSKVIYHKCRYPKSAEK